MKRYILRAEITIVELHDNSSAPPKHDSMDQLAGMATKVLSGLPMMIAPPVQPDSFNMTKSIEISGGFQTVADTMKLISETLEKLAIETV